MAANGKIDLKTARLLDANLNRAKEGLRVVEDVARFFWNDKNLYTRLRSMRHKLQSSAQKQYPILVESRHSQKDVGRKISEGSRKSVSSVVVANIKRAQEATRVLEEFGKVFSPRAAKDFKAIRYALYTTEKGLLKRTKL